MTKKPVKKSQEKVNSEIIQGILIKIENVRIEIENLVVNAKSKGV